MPNNNLSPINSIIPENNNSNSSNILHTKISFLKDHHKLKIFVLWSVTIVFLALFSATAFLYRHKVDPKSLMNPDSTISTNNQESINKFTDNSLTSSEFDSPINGKYISQDTYDKIMQKKPVSVMINNHVLARPQAGISQADIIYEIVAEGGISRFLGIFHTVLPEKVGPVRSMRKYFQQITAEYFPISTHWGISYRSDYEKNLTDEEFAYLMSQNGAETDPRADARSYVDEISLPTLDQTALPADVASDLFYKDTNLALPTEHTAFIRLNRVYDDFIKVYPEESWIKFQNFDQWSFIGKDDLNTYSSDVSSFSYNFWDLPDFETFWKFNSEEGIYERTQGSDKTLDRNNNSMPPIKTVIVQKAKETKLSDVKGHLLYDVIGSGDATIYQNGKSISAKWSKTSARSRTMFTTEGGAPVYFNRGLIWVVILPDYDVVTENNL